MAEPASSAVEVEVGVEGMTCHSCVSLIESGIGELDGVESVRVSLEEKRATIVYDRTKTSTEIFHTAIEDMGFIVTGEDGKTRVHARLNNIRLVGEALELLKNTMQ